MAGATTTTTRRRSIMPAMICEWCMQLNLITIRRTRTSSGAATTTKATTTITAKAI